MNEDYYIKQLHCSISEQEFNMITNKIKKEANIKYNMFILPPEGKEYWENCAKIIIQLDDKTIIPLIPKMLEYFQDLNWPGAMEIFNRINEIENPFIETYILQCIEKAYLERDYIWIEFLLWLRQSKTKKVVERIKKIVEEQNSIENKIGRASCREKV